MLATCVIFVGLRLESALSNKSHIIDTFTGIFVSFKHLSYTVLTIMKSYDITCYDKWGVL